MKRCEHCGGLTRVLAAKGKDARCQHCHKPLAKTKHARYPVVTDGCSMTARKVIYYEGDEDENNA